MVEACDNCGAPHRDGLAECEFCDVPIRGRTPGVECPQCGEMATADRRSCAACSASFMKGCVFCGQASFLTASTCRCGEAFAGAEERKKQRDERAKEQQLLGIAAQGVSLLGQVAGTPTGRGMLGQIVEAVLHSNDPKSGR